MVTRDRAENRDGPKVSGGRRGSRAPWLGQSQVRGDAGDAGLQGSDVHGRPTRPGAGEEDAGSAGGDAVGQDLPGRQEQRSLGFG